jgi:hypothetical protein
MAGRRLSAAVAGRVIGAGLLLAALAGCAHRPPVPATLDLRSLETRHAALLEARRARLVGTIAELSLWLETAAGRYPGAHATYALGGPDTVRMRVASAFGTAVDAAGIGDSLFLWVPARRTLVRMAAGAPPLELPEAAAFGVRAAAASWPVPAGAWRTARAADTLTLVRWLEAADTMEVAVGASGLPRFARLARPGMKDMRVTYLAYGSFEGTPWPTRFDVEDSGESLRLSVRVRRFARAGAADRGRWRPEAPADANVLAPEELWRWIEEEWAP